MVKMTGIYSGEKHCELTHAPSGSKIETDAPLDNQGKGERFSPTDLVAAALGSCVVTTIAIVAERDGVPVKGTTFEVTKEMVSDPRRRIGTLALKVRLPASVPQEYRSKLEHVARHCPVHQSLRPDVQMPMTFEYA